MLQRRLPRAMFARAARGTRQARRRLPSEA